MRLIETTKSKDPISYFFLHDAPPASNDAIGIQLATKMVGDLFRDNPRLEKAVLKGYLFAWNGRYGNPFTNQEILDLCDIQPSKPEPKASRSQKHEANTAGMTPMFDLTEFQTVKQKRGK